MSGGGAPPSPARLLRIYLNDHLAAATVGLRLARRCRRNNRAGPLGSFLGTLVDELEEDTQTLAGLLQRLGLRVDRAKLAGVAAGEALGRLKLNGQLTGYSGLSRVEELEGLTALLAFHARGWQALAQVGEGDDRLPAAVLAERAARASRQGQALGRHHHDAVARALATE